MIAYGYSFRVVQISLVKQVWSVFLGLLETVSIPTTAFSIHAPRSVELVHMFP